MKIVKEKGKEKKEEEKREKRARERGKKWGTKIGKGKEKENSEVDSCLLYTAKVMTV